ncbi:MAG: iron-sulfur protein, partial [Actinobacteria bacterium]|nr:iron-sulfur protein [Actinomycetota bacterium]
MRIKSKPEHAWILGVLLAIGVSGFGTEMFRIAAEQAAGKNVDYERWSVVGWLLAQTVNGFSLDTLQLWHQGWWVFHVITFIAFLALLPITMLRHIFTSPLNMYLRDRERP